MKTVSKSIAIQMKKMKDMEKKGDTGVYGKKLHANQSDVLKVQDVGKNQTFNQIISGGQTNVDGEGAQSRKNQIKLRQHYLSQEKAKRKQKRLNEEKAKDSTAETYKTIVKEMGERWEQGYSTSEDEMSEEEPTENDEQNQAKQQDQIKTNEKKAQLELELAVDHSRYPYIISARSDLRFAWDVIIIFFALIIACSLPFELAFGDNFDENIKDFMNNLDNVLTVVFTMDIIAGFLTSFINVSSGDEIFGPGMIAKNYIVNDTFLLDIVSTFPLDKIAHAFNAPDNWINILRILGLLKMQRIRRVSKIISSLNGTQETKAFYKVAQMVFLLILYIHILACLLWITFRVEQTWIPAVDFIYVNTDLFQTDFTKQYLSMCYHAIMVFGLNEVNVRERTEILVVIFMMIFSAILNAYIFGEMAVLVQEMDKKDIEFQESLDNANTAMHSLDIPNNIQDDIREYLMSVNEYKTQQNEMKDFMESISPSLKADVNKYIFFVAINNNSLILKILKNQDYVDKIKQMKFKKAGAKKAHKGRKNSNAIYNFLCRQNKVNDDPFLLYQKIIKQKALGPEARNFFNDIVSRMEIDFRVPEDKILKQNDARSEENYMFFIERGECIVQINDKDKMRNKSKKVRTLYPGDHFGEIAFLYNSNRSTTVTTTNYTTLGKISQNEVYNLFNDYPFFKEELIKRSIRYDDDLKIFLESALKTIDYLHGVPEETINKIIFSMTFAKFDKGSKIFQVDETSTIMQIIQNGMVEIYTQMDNGVDFVIERLYRGSVINHRSFITEDKIDVNARCQMPVTLFYITWNKMSEIKESSPKLAERIEDVEFKLVNKDNPIALDYIISRDATVLRKNKQRSRKEQIYRDGLTVKLKNAVMVYIVKTRMLKRIPNFNEILNMAINKKRREMQAARRKQQEFDLDQLGPEDTYLTEEQFSLIKEQIEKIKLTLDDQETKIHSLKVKLLNLIKKNPSYQQY